MLRRLRIVGLALILVLSRALPFAVGPAAMAAGAAPGDDICSVSGANNAAAGEERGAPHGVQGKHCQLCVVGGVALASPPLALLHVHAAANPGCPAGSFQAPAPALTPPGTGPPFTR